MFKLLIGLVVVIVFFFSSLFFSFRVNTGRGERAIDKHTEKKGIMRIKSKQTI
jgi:hypothetical protein